jgi:hypothetical protein
MVEKRLFDGGMNMDDDETRIEPNQYRYALNIRNGNSEKGSVGTITNAEGNTLVSVTLPSGGNKVIGVYDDEPRDRIIYVVYNTGGLNLILCYNYKAQVVQTVLRDYNNILDLDPNYLITGINVVEGDANSYLLMTDDNGEPKNINIEAGVRTFDTNSANGEYTYRKYIGDWDDLSATSAAADQVYKRGIVYTNSAGGSVDVDFYYRCTADTTNDPTASTSSGLPSEDWEICPSGYVYTVQTVSNVDYISAEWQVTNIVKPPLAYPDMEYGTNGNGYNYLKGSLWQVKYKYVCNDGRESSWSPITPLQNPKYLADSILTKSEYKNDNEANSLTLFLEAPDTNHYKQIKISVRRVLSDKSPDDWYLFDTIKTNDVTNRYYDTSAKIKSQFDNSNTLMPLDQSEVNQLFSWVPDKAQAQGVTSGNRLIYGNFSEGKEYSLDGVYGINKNPPTAEFYERSNPYITLSPLTAQTFNSSVFTTVTAETFFDPVIKNASGVGFKFPASVQVGADYTINVGVKIAASVGNGINIPAQLNFLKILTYSASSTNSSALVDQFVAGINNSKYITSDAFAGTSPYQLLTATNVASGGSSYLKIIPLSGFTSNGFTYNVFIQNVPTSQVAQVKTAIQTFKRGTSQKFAIAYADKYGRLSTAIRHPNLEVTSPWWRDTVYSAITASGVAGNVLSAIGARYAQIQFNHDAPEWAEKFYIVKTLSNGLDYYKTFVTTKAVELANLLRYATTTDPSGYATILNMLQGKYFYRGYIKTSFDDLNYGMVTSATSLGGQELLYIPVTSLQGSPFSYNSLTRTDVNYEFVKGDRVRACYNITPVTASGSANVSDYYTSSFDAEILDYNTQLNCLILRVNDLPNEYVNSASSTVLFASANTAGATNGDIAGLVLEIYRPTKDRGRDFYYEMYAGDVASADVGGVTRYFHNGNFQNQTSAQSAIINLTNGDSYLKPRTYAVVASGGTGALVAASSRSYQFFVEDESYYDKTPSKAWGAGRPNALIRSTSNAEDYSGFLGEVQRPTTIRYSKPFLAAQGYNGLGTFYDIDFKDANPALRSIQKLHTEGNRIIVLHENAVGWAETDRVVAKVGEGNIVIEGNTPLSDIIYYQGRHGISTNPESFAANGSRKYFVDIDQGQVCRLSQDGVTVISDKKMNKYIKQVFREMQQSENESYIFGAYDKRFDDYILVLKWPATFEPTTEEFTVTASGATLNLTASGYDFFEGGTVPITLAACNRGATYYSQKESTAAVTTVSGSSITLSIALADRAQAAVLGGGIESAWYFRIYPLNTRTLVFNERLSVDINRQGAWSSFMSYPAENLSPAGIDLVSFRAGKLYIHNDYANPASYYGTDYPSYIDIVSNPAADGTKVWKGISLKGNFTSGDEANISVPIASEDTTRAVEAVGGGITTSNEQYSTTQSFVFKEGQIYAPVLRTGSGTSYSSYIEGDKVRGYWIKTRIKIAAGVTKIYKILEAAFDFIPSNYNQ